MLIDWIRERRWRRDLVVALAFSAGAVWVFARLWSDPSGRQPVQHISDPQQHKWFLMHAAKVILDGAEPFYSSLLNVPTGVNLMANTSMLGLGIPLAPVTLLLGPDISFVLALTLGLSGTAFAWYWFLSRHVVTSSAAAIVGGAFCGFGPGMVSHASWHTNFAAQFLVPLIVWRVLRLNSPGVLRNGAILGVLVAYQVFVNEEILLFTALACGVFLGWMAIQCRLFSLGFLKALGVAGLVAFALLAYPLWVQFFGAQHYHGLNIGQHRADVLSYVAYATESISGVANANVSIAPNLAEENTFFGWPLMVLVVVIAVWQRKEVVARSVALTALVFGALSLGSPLWIGGVPTTIKGPWGAFDRLPILDSVLPIRFGLVVAMCFGVLLALGVDAFMKANPPKGSPLRLIGAGALAVALVPLLPTPVTMTDRQPAPQFISEHVYRDYLADGETLVPIPLPGLGDASGMYWAALAGLEFAVPRGYFLGPQTGRAGDSGAFGGEPASPSVHLLNRVATGDTLLPQPTDAQHRDLREQLRAWDAKIVVLDARAERAALHRENLTVLFGPGTLVGNAWVWDVRQLVKGERK